MPRLIVATRQLAERRARLAAEVPRLERLVADASERLTQARAELAAVDLLLPTFDDRVVPQDIEPVAARAGRYGKRGVFRDALIEALREVAPAARSTAELSLLLRMRFELDFVGPERLKNWTDNTLRPQLRRLVAEGLVERVKVTGGHTDDAYWRVAIQWDEGKLTALPSPVDASANEATS